ncbi:hypothetical protein [Actinophytocola oryzae]|uniref:Aminoacyl-transfer RNA synthetases class-II family profile domain-containing protein n=1 Tax=Actinophytocola oryzae TaxID=502181 RepID=A0A4R7VKL5_9PSEU|nr:hypothetical protein [Actinophytocola oryzae]TDV49787.1 hypothetical protein CLV71_107135 [Actinophytocola oryzae]
MSPTVGTRIALRPPVPAALAGEVGSRLLFVSPEIVDYELGPVGDGDLREVTLYSDGPLGAAVEGKVHDMLDNDVRTQPAAPAGTVWTSPHAPADRGDLWPELCAAGVVHEAGEGQVAIGEPLLSLLEALDELVVEALAGDFTVHRYRYPTLISTRSLARSGYLANFPQHLMLVTRLRNDVEVYRRFRDEHAGGDGPGASVLELAGNVDYCLPPTMCYHTFSQLSGTVVDGDPVHVVTARGKAFRFEAGYATTLERLWDFTIREIVLIGGRDEVVAARERFMHTVFALAEDLGLAGTAQVANDPFFGATDTPARILSQRLLSLKYELRLPVAADRDIAVGSFNLHDNAFGTTFDIRAGSHRGAPVAHSACAGFGLERLAYAVLWQHGTDPAAWPEPLRRCLPGSGHR